MMKDVTRLKVRAIARLLEHQVVGEVLRVVANVQACDEHVRGLASALRRFDPENAEPAKFLRSERIGSEMPAALIDSVAR